MVSDGRQIPTISMLVDLLHEGKLTTEGYLDILEKRLEVDSELIGKDDLRDLWRGGRLTDEEYISFDKSVPDTKSELPNMDSLKDFYGDPEERRQKNHESNNE